MDPSGVNKSGTVSTPVLDIAYDAAGPADGPTAVLLHGFPYDVRCYDEVASVLADAGMRVVAPYLRGFGPTRYRSADIMRSGQQGALGQDLLDLLDALEIERAVVGGFDWGGRAACIAAAVAPERVTGLVTVGGYNIQDIARSAEPAPPEAESAAWYTHYFLTERGRAGLERYTDELCGLLWRQWSPTWADCAAAFAATSPSLHNPDFVSTVIHSYQHRRGAAPGDPRYDHLEKAAGDHARHHRADHCARRPRRRPRRRRLECRRAAVHRRFRSARTAGHRPQPAAGGSGSVRPRSPGRRRRQLAERPSRTLDERLVRLGRGGRVRRRGGLAGDRGGRRTG